MNLVNVVIEVVEPVTETTRNSNNGYIFIQEITLGDKTWLWATLAAAIAFAFTWPLVSCLPKKEAPATWGRFEKTIDRMILPAFVAVLAAGFAVVVGDAKSPDNELSKSVGISKERSSRVIDTLVGSEPGTEVLLANDESVSWKIAASDDRKNIRVYRVDPDWTETKEPIDEVAPTP